MIEKARFGRTGHMSTRTIFGAAALLKATDEESKRTLEAVLEYGVNHIDTAADYGESERLLGPWMDEHRDKFFLATKTGDRSYQGAKDSLKRSLDLLHVDQVDLIQLHCLIDPKEWDQAMGAGGALEALVEAREKGWTRFIGVTGHGTEAPSMHLKSLERFDFDTVLLPFNYAMMRNPAYRRDFEKLVAVCEGRDVPVQTIKAVARRLRRDKSTDYITWYEPLQDQASIDQSVHWVLGRPGVFLNTVGDVDILPKVFDAASRHQAGTRPSDEEMDALLVQSGIEPLFPIPEDYSV
jgi:aryl-alcohol dehydrogenase-like predicted oxidoreductase